MDVQEAKRRIFGIGKLTVTRAELVELQNELARDVVLERGVLQAVRMKADELEKLIRRGLIESSYGFGRGQRGQNR